MDHIDNDLLLSAYLDGELTAAEQANVEQLLAASAEARQLVEELRTLRASLQELPRHKLEPEFAEQVLRRAEAESRESEPGSQESPRATGSDSAVPHPSLPTADRPLAARILNRRGLAWSVVAIAAAVLLVVTNRPADRQPIARRAPDQETIVQAPPLAGSETLAGAAVEPQSVTHSVSAAEPRFAAANPDQNGHGSLSLSAAPADASMIQGEGTAPARTKLLGDLQPMAPLAVDRAPLAADRMDALKSSYRDSFGISQDSTSPLGTEQAAESRELGTTAGAQVGQSALASDKPVPPAAMPAPTSAGIAGDSGAGAKSDYLYWKDSQVSDDLVVIHVDVSPEAARSGVFDKLLAQNQITMDDKSGALGLRRQQSEQRSAEVQMRLKAVEENELERQSDKSDGAVRDLEAIASDEKLPARLSGAADMDAVLVEAAPEQIQSTFAALRNDPAEFPKVAVTGPQELRDRLLTDATEKPAEKKNQAQSEGEKYGEKYNEQPEALNRQTAARQRDADRAADTPANDLNQRAAPMGGGGARGGRGRGAGGGFGGGGGGAGGFGGGRGGASGGQFGGGAPPAGGLGASGVSGSGVGGSGFGGSANGIAGGAGGASGPTNTASSPTNTASGPTNTAAGSVAAGSPAKAEQGQQFSAQFGRATRLSLYDRKIATDEKPKLSDVAKDSVAKTLDGRSAPEPSANLDAAATTGTRGTTAANVPQPALLGDSRGEEATNGVAAAGAVAPPAADGQKESAGRLFSRSSEAKGLAESGDVTKSLPTTTRRALFVLRTVNPPANSTSAAASPEPAKPAAAAPAAAPAATEPAKR